MSEPPIRLESSEFFAPNVDAYLEERVALGRALPEFERPPFLVRLIYSPYFYLSLAGLAGGLAGWAVTEPFIDEKALQQANPNQPNRALLVGMLIFPTIIAMIGLFVGAVEGLVSRNYLRGVVNALTSATVGFFGALVLQFPLALILAAGAAMAVEAGLLKNGQVQLNAGFFIFMVTRGLYWGLLSVTAGVGQGVAMRRWKVAFNGLLGGLLGGLAGGLLFDPIDFTLNDPRDKNSSAWVSRAVGFAAIGLMVGFFIGLVEQWTKTAWFMMRAGALAGKQFVMHHNPTLLGSSPKADIYLFKDPDIDPRHASITDRGGRYTIEDLDSKAGTFVNGERVNGSRALQTGDVIEVGKTVLEFSLREAK